MRFETASVRPTVDRAEEIREYLKRKRQLERRLRLALTKSARQKIEDELRKLESERRSVYEVRS